MKHRSPVEIQIEENLPEMSNDCEIYEPRASKSQFSSTMKQDKINNLARKTQLEEARKLS